MKLIQFGVRSDYGKEYYMTLLTGRRYSLLQAAVDYGEYGNWIEWPYLQISMGYGRLFSFLFSIGRLGFTFDIAGRNWRDELFYCQPNENKTNLD
jgi:hypothetical protein